MNATHFFERWTDKSLPASSESFWTAVFALFLVHLSSREGGVSSLPLWRPLRSGPPWYERKAAELVVPPRTPLALNDLAIEPTEVSNVWPALDLDPSLAGISPDIVARFASSADNAFLLLVENKITTGASLSANQTNAYPRLLELLAQHAVPSVLWVLQPVGCSQKLCAATRRLESRLTSRFGIVLWEDVFRFMQATYFCLPGLDIMTLQGYVDDAVKDCRAW